MKIRRRKSPALVGLTEAAEILGMKRQNVRTLRGLPEPLQDRGIEGFAAIATPLWPRAEICELAAKRAESKRGLELLQEEARSRHAGDVGEVER